MVIEHSHADGDLWLSVNQAERTDGGYEWVAEIKHLMTDEARQWADACLIAAAPEMKKCGHRLAVLALQSERYTTDSEYHCAVDDMLAALAKTER